MNLKREDIIKAYTEMTVDIVSEYDSRTNKSKTLRCSIASNTFIIIIKDGSQQHIYESDNIEEAIEIYNNFMKD